MYILSFHKETYFQVQATNSSSVQVGTYTVGLFPMGLVTQDKTPFNQEVPKNDDEARLTKRVPIAIMSCNSHTWNKSDSEKNITYELETSGLVQLSYSYIFRRFFEFGESIREFENIL